MKTPARRQIVLATRNRDKVIEMRDALAAMPIDILTLESFPSAPEVVEDGDTLEANAAKKAMAIHAHTGLPALADDTGLFVEALHGAPGVFSSRYAGERASYRDNVQKLLAALKDVPEHKRGAEFRSVIAFAVEGEVHFIKGACAGNIGSAPKGAGQFGYDPVFIAHETQRTFAEMTLAEKNLVSHRGRALAAFKDFVRKLWLL
ncbi:MAG: RdgB/HAM1 family non-canonical purine NTP pyrophosphatase [candidate division KSB1 bacterium]